MARLLTVYRGCDVGFTAEELADFAKQWPCFGSQTSPADFRGAALFFSFDERGDLVDVQGDDGLDGAAVLALSDDAKRHAIACGFNFPIMESVR